MWSFETAAVCATRGESVRRVRNQIRCRCVGLLSGFFACPIAASHSGHQQQLVSPFPAAVGVSLRTTTSSSLHALVVYEIQKIESEALKLFPVRVSFTSDHQVIPVGAIAAQGSGTPLTVSECVLWICQIQKMITAESVT